MPVNPNVRDVLGVPAFRTLAEAVAATGPFDMVDVFRRSELCVPHAREAVAAGARCLWLQLGVVDWEAARIAHDGGPRGRHGPLHGHRVAADRRAGWPTGPARGWRRPAPSADEEPEEDEHDADDRDRATDLRLAAEDGHRDRRAGRAVVADAATPRFVAGDVRVLGLELLVARPRAAAPGV